MDTYIKDIIQTEYGPEGTLFFPLFQTEITVSIPDEKDIAYAQACAEYLCNMPQDTVSRLCKYMIRYLEGFRHLLEELEEEDGITIPENISGTDILQYVYPSCLIVDTPDDPSVIGFHMECNCDWEPEHGLEFTIKDNKILYVGSFDDMPAWNQPRLDYAGFYNPDEYMSMNYADKEI